MPAALDAEGNRSASPSHAMRLSASSPIHHLALPSTCYTPCALPACPLTHCCPYRKSLGLDIRVVKQPAALDAERNRSAFPSHATHHVQPCPTFPPSPLIHCLALPSTCYTPCASPACPPSHCLPVQDGTTSLIAASQNGHLEVARLLLDRGANANAVAQVDRPHTHVRSHSRDANTYTLCRQTHSFIENSKEAGILLGTPFV